MEKRGRSGDRVSNGAAASPSGQVPEDTKANKSNVARDDYNEQTLDGYTVIQEANSRSSRQDELLAMREARRKNRMGQSGVDMSKLPNFDNPPYGE